MGKKTKEIIHIEARQGHHKMTPEELQAHLVARRSGHIHTDKSKQISRKQKYNKRIA